MAKMSILFNNQVNNQWRKYGEKKKMASAAVYLAGGRGAVAVASATVAKGGEISHGNGGRKRENHMQAAATGEMASTALLKAWRRRLKAKESNI